MTNEISDVVREVDSAFWIIGIACLVLLIGVTVAMVAIVVKYPRSRVKKIPQIDGNLKLEITWVVLPTIISIWMFYVAYDGFVMMRNPPDNAMEVDVIARQWSWEFNYPDTGVTAMEMVVPVNTPVKVMLNAPSSDVLHSFFLPDFRVKEDVVPGKESFVWFESNRTGTFNIFCAEFCGKGHSEMLSLLHVVTLKEYKEWTRREIAKRFKPLKYEGIVNPKDPTFGKDDLNINAEQMFGTYCATCHGKSGDGSGLPGVARNFQTDKDWKNGTKVTEIYKTLHEGIKDSQMRPFPNLSPWETVALAHHVRSFLPPNKRKKDSQADYNALVKKYSLDKQQGPGETIPVEEAMKRIEEEAKTLPSEKQ